MGTHEILDGSVGGYRLLVCRFCNLAFRHMNVGMDPEYCSKECERNESSQSMPPAPNCEYC